MMKREDVHRARIKLHSQYVTGQMELDEYLAIMDFLCSLEHDSSIVDQCSPEVAIYYEEKEER